MSKKTLVFFLLNNKKKYISNLTKLQTGKIIPEYDTDIKNAFEFEKSQLKKTLKFIHNPYFRKFYTEEVNVAEIIRTSEIHSSRGSKHLEPDTADVGDSRIY